MPILVVNGTEDMLVDEEESVKTLKSAWSSKDGALTFVSVRGAGHMPFWEKPKEVRVAMLEFVKRVVESNSLSIRATFQ